MTTTITIGDTSFDADSYTWDDNGTTRPVHWIATGDWLHQHITEQAEHLITTIRRDRRAADLPVRSEVDAAMRLQRDITAYWGNEKVLVAPGTVTSYIDDLPSLAFAVEQLLTKLPDLARHAVTA